MSMTLTTRLSLFFLGALALVLAGFSATLYYLAQTYLYRQVDERLTAAVHTLTAAAAVDNDSVRWQPQDREVTIGRDPGPDQVRWLVRDASGKVVQRSANLGEQQGLVEV